MGNAPQFSNTKVKFNRPVSSSEDNPGQQIKVSVWLNFDNGWDETSNRPFPPTPEQQKSIEDIHKQIKNLGMELSLQLQEADSKMNIARSRAFCNELRYDSNPTDNYEAVKNGEVNGFDSL